MLLLRSSLRELARHPLRSALSVAGIAVGVAAVVGVELASESARRAFRYSVDATAGRATHHLQAIAGDLDERIYVRLRTESGLREAAPVIETVATLEGAPPLTLRLLGVDPFAAPQLAPALPLAELDLGSFLGRSGGLLLPRSVAAERRLEVGSMLELRVRGRPLHARLDGLFEDRGVLAEFALVDLATAQEWTGASGRLTRVDLRLADGDEGREALARLRATLPAGVEVTATAARVGALEEMTRAFRLNLTALSLLALVCGAFLVFNTATVSVLQRRPLFGRLRALGVARREIVGVVLLEAAAVGLAGSLAGLALGAALGRGLVGQVSRTIEDLYFDLAVGDFTLAPEALARGLGIGLAVTVIAALRPALEAASVPPRVVLLRSELESRVRRALPRQMALALLLAGAGALLLAATRALSIAFAGLFLVLAGAALLAPSATVALLTTLERPFGRWLGPLARLASRSVVASLSRTGVAIAALALAIAVTSGVDLMISSFRAAVASWLDVVLAGDVYVAAPFRGAAEQGPRIEPAVVAAMAQLDGVAAVHRLSARPVATSRGEARLVGVDFDERNRSAFDLVAGEPEKVWTAVATGAAALASEPLAFRLGLTVGDHLTVVGASGPRELVIAGIHRDYGSDRGALLLSRSTFEQMLPGEGIIALSLFASPRRDPEALARAARDALPAGVELEVQSRSSLRARSLAVFDRTFAVTGVLRLLTLAVAVLGIFTALVALALERRRELAVLRVNGLEPRQLFRLVLAETAWMGGAAGLFAAPLGALLAGLMVHVINRRSFGWSMELDLSLAPLFAGLVVAIASALAAGLYPAWAMSRTSPAAALREE